MKIQGLLVHGFVFVCPFVSLCCQRSVSPGFRPFPILLGPHKNEKSGMLNVDWANFVCLRPNRESYSELYRNNLVQREGWLVQVARGEPVLSTELCVQVS